MPPSNNNEYNDDPVLINQQYKMGKIDREISECDRIIKNIVDSYPPRTPVHEFDRSSDHRSVYLYYLNKRNAASEKKRTVTLEFIKELNREIEYCENTIEDVIESEAAGESVEEYSEEHQDAYNNAIDRRTSYFERTKQLERELQL